MSYVYIKSEPGLWTVGFFDPNGNWQPESDHSSTEEAAKRVAWLNGGDIQENLEIRLNSQEYYRPDATAYWFELWHKGQKISQSDSFSIYPNKE